MCVQLCTGTEKVAIDAIIDTGPQLAGELDKTVLHGKSVMFPHKGLWDLFLS